jgi:predicted phage tail protein
MRMAGSALEKWGKNRDNDFGYYGNRNGGGMSGGGVQSSGDFTVVYPQQQQPYTIQGSKSPWGGVLGAVGALAAPFTGGASMALGGIGSLF